MKKIFLFWKKVAFILLVSVISLRVFLVPITVFGDSMEPNIHSGEKGFLVRNFFGVIPNIERFDIVIINTDSNIHLIKRVVALPGEHIRYAENTLYIDGEKIEEPFDVIFSEGEHDIFDEGITLGSDEYFVLGDNRNSSLDSRSFGSIKENHIYAVQYSQVDKDNVWWHKIIFLF
jgi:signal peptidase I